MYIIYLMYLERCLLANTLVIAAVSVVFPWSTCPIVPTLQCGFGTEAKDEWRNNSYPNKSTNQLKVWLEFIVYVECKVSKWFKQELGMA